MFWQENVSKRGIEAMNLTTDFDERSILEKNLVYLTATLEVFYEQSYIIYLPKLYIIKNIIQA